MMIEDLETIDNWLKEEYGISYTELCQEFNGAVELNIKYLNKIAQKDEEIERLNNIINEFNNAYSKVITKCNQMINSRYYMNETAIAKYAAEIKDICYFYVEEAKELKGDDKE